MRDYNLKCTTIAPSKALLIRQFGSRLFAVLPGVWWRDDISFSVFSGQTGPGHVGLAQGLEVWGSKLASTKRGEMRLLVTPSCIYMLCVHSWLSNVSRQSGIVRVLIRGGGCVNACWWWSVNHMSCFIFLHMLNTEDLTCGCEALQFKCAFDGDDGCGTKVMQRALCN